MGAQVPVGQQDVCLILELPFLFQGYEFAELKT